MLVLAALLIAASSMTATLSAQEGGGAPRRPNILFCMADDWGWPHAGALGDEVVRTPTFDRLAREGVLFERAYVSSPSCTPSRNAILTGQQFYRLGEGANLHSTLDVSHPNFMSALREAGYRIGHWRKSWGPGTYQAGGYTEDPCGPGSTFDKFLAAQDADEPFCFWFGTSDPHRGYQRGSGEQSGIDPSKLRVPAFLPDHPEVRSDIADYYFEVQRWDSDVGQALELLEQRGLLDDTIVVMTGDHGMPFPRCKGNLYDWGSRVPLAVRWGESVQPGRAESAFVSLTDLAPTFLQAAGVDTPEVMTGSSLLPLLTAPESPAAREGRDFVVYGRERHTPAQRMPSIAGYPSRAIRTDRWLLIQNLVPERWPAGVPEDSTHPMGRFSDCDNGPTKQLILAGRDDPAIAPFYELCFGQREYIELYDCEADPDQVRDLVNDADFAEVAEVVSRLSAQLSAYRRETADPRALTESVAFDDYPYRAGYLAKRIEQFRKTRPELFVAPSLRAPTPGETLLLDFAWTFGLNRHASLDAFRKAVIEANADTGPKTTQELAVQLTDSTRCYVLYEGLDAEPAKPSTRLALLTATEAAGFTVADLLWQTGELAHDAMAQAEHRRPAVISHSTVEQARAEPRNATFRKQLLDPELPVFQIWCGR